MMGRKTAHFKPYWAFIGTGSRRRKEPQNVVLNFILFGIGIVVIFISSLLKGCAN